MHNTLETEKTEIPPPHEKGGLQVKLADGSTRKANFVDYFQRVLAARAGTAAVFYADYATNTHFRSCIDQLCLTREILIELGKKERLSENHPDFDKQQIEWWAHYKKVILLREHMIPFFEVPPPNWGDLLSDREDFGVLMSEEDFEKYIRNPPKGIGLSVREPENMDDYTPMEHDMSYDHPDDIPKDGKVGEEDIDLDELLN